MDRCAHLTMVSTEIHVAIVEKAIVAIISTAHTHTFACWVSGARATVEVSGTCTITKPDAARDHFLQSAVCRSLGLQLIFHRPPCSGKADASAVCEQAARRKAQRSAGQGSTANKGDECRRGCDLDLVSAQRGLRRPSELVLLISVIVKPGRRSGLDLRRFWMER